MSSFIIITAQLLIRLGIPPTQAKAFELPLAYACERFQINTARRLAAFVGQCAVESTNFAQLEENLYYSSYERIRQVYPLSVPSEAMARSLTRKPQELANRVYANKLGNGEASSGDGWRYRGRGLIQLTGKNNYKQAAFACQRPYLDTPELVAKPADAALTAAWFWACNGCNQLADVWAIDKTTQVINGQAMRGRLQRRQRCDEILAILNEDD